jgi:hypothetical protein
MSDSSWVDKGCWNENTNWYKPAAIRAIPNQAPSTKTYNFDTCKAFAEQKNVDTFSLQFGGDCFYGENSDYEQYGKASQCNALGGSLINHVYTKASAPVTWYDKGCWIDKASRTISNTAPGGGVYSVGSCKAYALSENVDTIGLQNPTTTGSFCFYGNSPDYNILGEAPGVCDLTGGSLINHVYSITSDAPIHTATGIGSSYTNSSNLPRSEQDTPPQPQDPSSSSSDKTRNIIIVVVSVVVLLIIIGLIVYFIHKNKTQSQTWNTYTPSTFLSPSSSLETV